MNLVDGDECELDLLGVLHPLDQAPRVGVGFTVEVVAHLGGELGGARQRDNLTTGSGRWQP